MRGRAESLALKMDREGKEQGRWAVARLLVGGGAGYAYGRKISPVLEVGVHWGQACFA